MTDYRYSTSLRLRHPAWDPMEATTTLKLAPSRSWRAGDARKSPKGDILNGFREASYWTTNLSKGNSKQIKLRDALANAVAVTQLDPHTKFFVDFAACGGKSEFFIFWFFDEGNSGDVLDWRLLERLARLRMDLSFDIYGMGTIVDLLKGEREER